MEALLILKSWPFCALSLCGRNMWSGGGKKGSGIGDFHNYASQAVAAMQLTVFFLLPCQAGLPWLSDEPPPPAPATPQPPALLFQTHQYAHISQ